MNAIARRTGYIFLCTVPFLDLIAASVRTLRIPGVYQAIGGVVFGLSLVAAWIVGARAVTGSEAGPRKFALAGLLLILPFAIVALLWVGIGAPFQATLPENYMRFLVLVWNSILVTSAFVILKDALYEVGERFYSTVGFAASVSAGAAYLVCLNISLGQVAMALGGDRTPPPPLVVTFYSALEFVACVMTYLTTAIFATALGRARILGRGGARVYATASTVLVLLIVMRGLQFPEISGNTAPWYTQPGVIAGIPAIPWLMPCLLGVVLLQYAGNEQSNTEPA